MKPNANKHKVMYVMGVLKLVGVHIILAWLSSRGIASKQTPRRLTHW